MTQHVQSVNPPVLAIDAGNQLALVAANVEHDAASHVIGTPKSLSNTLRFRSDRLRQSARQLR
jgi:hypothetical protein